ncbi:MAG: hypothetical protein AB8G14_14035 [Ilumatobacter sp.]
MSFAPPDPLDAPISFDPPSEAATPAAQALLLARPGDLTGMWRALLGLGWVAAFFAYAGVWQASVQIGIGTWWIGPRAQPTNIAIRLLPFVLALVMSLMIVYSVRHLVRWSAAGVGAAALIAVPDFSRSLGLGVAEAAIAGLLGIITLASLSGRYRAVAASPDAASD